MRLFCFNLSFDFLIDDLCLDEFCKNGGICIVVNNVLGFECNCILEYIGFNCGILKGDIYIFFFV